MSRSTTALKRLGVPGLAAVTAVASLPMFLGSASAAHVTAISITPETASSAAGTCRIYNGTVTPAQATTVDVQLVPNTTTQDVNFCSVNTDGTVATTPAGGANANAITGGAGAAESREFTTVAEGGAFSFGVISNEVGTVNITAFVEAPNSANNGNGIPNGPENGEVQDTSVLTVTAGGIGAVTRLVATPEQRLSAQGGNAVFTVTATNAQGQPVSGVLVEFDVTGGPDAAAVIAGTDCTGTTNQLGQVTCTVPNTGGPGTDTVVFVVNQVNADANVNTADTLSVDAGEPSDSSTAVFQAAQAAGTTVSLVPSESRTDAFATAQAGTTTSQRPLSDTTQSFTATVRNAAGVVQSGVLVTFTGPVASGTTDDAGTTASPDVESINPDQALTDANGNATVTLTNPRPTSGEVFTVTAEVAVTGGNSVDSASVLFVNPAANEARTLVLLPEAATRTVGDVQSLTATVTDRFGTPVSGVQVTFTEEGTGRFTTGGTTAVETTNASGRATVELTSNFGETAGGNTVTATITSNRTAGAGNDECEQVANTTIIGGPQTVVTAAGDCDDTSRVAFVPGTIVPSPGTSAPATATPTITPTANPVCRPLTVTLERTTIVATGSTGVTVTGAPANSQIELLAYSRPNTTYRVVRQALINASATPAQFRIVPPTNTRLYARVAGCPVADIAAASVVLNVRTQLSLAVVRNGTRNYTFSGRALPARTGGLIVSLYRVTNDGRQILAAQTRVNAANGTWVINRRFTGSGRFGFVVRTGQDLQNAPGVSNVRSLLVF